MVRVRDESSIYVEANVSYAKGNYNLDGLKMIEYTIRDLLNKMAREFPDHVAFVFEQNGGLELTYAELNKRVETMARNLLALGFNKGDRLAFVLPYTVETLVIIFACAYIGVLSAPIDYMKCTQYLDDTLKIINPKGYITVSNFNNTPFFDQFKMFCPEIDDTCEKGNLKSSLFPNLKHVIVANNLENCRLNDDENSDDYKNVWDINEILEENPAFEIDKTELPELSAHDPVFMMPTVNNKTFTKAILNI